MTPMTRDEVKRLVEALADRGIFFCYAVEECGKALPSGRLIPASAAVDIIVRATLEEKA
jgi:hypothetical protein